MVWLSPGQLSSSLLAQEEPADGSLGSQHHGARGIS